MGKQDTIKLLMTIKVDSHAAVNECLSPGFSKASRHINVAVKALNKLRTAGVIEFEEVDSKVNLADALTKVLPKPLFDKHAEAMGVTRPPPTQDG